MENYPHDKQSAFNVQLRMNPLLVKKNGRYSIWDSDKIAKLYFITLVIEDKNSLLNGSIYLDSFSNVSNDDYIDIHKILYDYACAEDNVPLARLFFISTVIRCKAGLKEPTDILHNLKNDAQYKELAEMFTSLVSDMASFPFIVNIALKILEVIKKHSGKIDSSPLATTTHYFSKKLGDLDKAGKFYLDKCTQNVDFYFELIVRDPQLTPGIGDVPYQYTSFNPLRNSSSMSIEME